MSRRTKAQIEQDKLSEQKQAKALGSLSENMAKLLKKHMGQLMGGKEFSIVGKITADGIASIRLNYTAQVEDSHGFTLDDGQQDLPLPPTGEGAETPGDGKGAGDES